jgi:hypothetical protein
MLPRCIVGAGRYDLWCSAPCFLVVAAKTTKPRAEHSWSRAAMRKATTRAAHGEVLVQLVRSALSPASGQEHYLQPLPKALTPFSDTVSSAQQGGAEACVRALHQGALTSFNAPTAAQHLLSLNGPLCHQGECTCLFRSPGGTESYGSSLMPNSLKLSGSTPGQEHEKRPPGEQGTGAPCAPSWDGQ